MVLSIMALDIMTFSKITLSIIIVNTDCCYAVFLAMLNVVMLNVVALTSKANFISNLLV